MVAIGLLIKHIPAILQLLTSPSPIQNIEKQVRNPETSSKPRDHLVSKDALNRTRSILLHSSSTKSSKTDQDAHYTGPYRKQQDAESTLCHRDWEAYGPRHSTNPHTKRGSGSHQDHRDHEYVPPVAYETVAIAAN